MKVQPDEMRLLSQYIHSICGISLDATKSYLVESRLSDLAVTSGCATFADLYQKAKADLTKTLQRKIIDNISTGETSFFRDTAPFEMLQHKILPDLVDRRKASAHGMPITIRVWSAACSTGQEVYSIAFALKETLGDLNHYNIRLVGTDISDRAVGTASRAIYSRLEIDRGLAADKLARYFSETAGSWKVRDEMRALATFKRINLLEDLTPLGRFDIIFCRNVAIYFNEADRISLFDRLGRLLEPDGYLVIGSTESITGISTLYESNRHLRSVYYQLKSFSGRSF
jgi:chemotaxis protein methyltransferase CheR